MTKTKRKSSVSFDEIVQALAEGRRVSWRSSGAQRTSGHVLATEQPEWLVMVSDWPDAEPFKSGFVQSLALGIEFAIENESQNNGMQLRKCLAAQDLTYIVRIQA